MSSDESHLPSIVVLDTNALRHAGLNLDAAWFRGAQAEVAELKVPFATTKLCFDEYTYAIRQRASDSLATLQRNIATVNSHAGIDLSISCPAEREIIKRSEELAHQRFCNSEMQIIANIAPEVDELIQDAVDKVYPFESGDKGFRDTIIIETICRHANILRKNPSVVLVTADNVFAKCQKRLVRHGVEVEVVAPENLPSMLASMVARHGNHVVKNISRSLLQFIKQNERAVKQALDNSEIVVSSSEIFGRESYSPKMQRVISVELKDIDLAYPKFPRTDQARDHEMDCFFRVTLAVTAEAEETFGGFRLSSLYGPSLQVNPQKLSQEGPSDVVDDDFSPSRRLQ